MKLKTTQTKEHEVELSIPCFFKDNDVNRYLAVLDEKTVFFIFISDNYTSIRYGLPSDESVSIMDAVNNFQPISEEEFLSVHAKALQSLSLKPISVDDLEGVDFR